MASQTTYYDLIKPSTSDPADIADINNNMDTIDGALNTLNTQKVGIPITIQATLSPTVYSRTINDSRIKSNHIVLSVIASSGSMAYLAVDVTVTTSNGQAVVSTPSAPSVELTMDITLIEQST